MRRLFSLTVLIFAILSLNSCEKEKDLKPISTMEVPSNPNIESPKWGQNDEIYKASLIAIARSLKKPMAKNEPEPEPIPLPYTCLSSGGNTYGLYQDPENLIIGGPFRSASSSGQETFFHTCSSISSAITSARTYLINEGYSDIVSELESQGENYKLIHAANSLMDLKKQVGISNIQTTKVANCIFQALGFTALAELGANWAGASRQVILRAVGKVATRYLGWFGAAIAIGSFVDCMWG